MDLSGMQQPKFLAQQEPSIIHTLNNCTLDLLRAGEDLIVMRFTPDGMEREVIDVPWDAADFRMMIAGWVARLGGRDNGSATAGTET